jgi:hypothetical protein
MRRWPWFLLAAAVLAVAVSACGDDGGGGGNGDDDGERVFRLATGDYTEAQLREFVRDTGQEFQETFNISIGETECLAAVEILLFAKEAPIDIPIFVPTIFVPTPAVQEANPEDEKDALELLRPECASLS